MSDQKKIVVLLVLVLAMAGAATYLFVIKPRRKASARSKPQVAVQPADTTLPAPQRLAPVRRWFIENPQGTVVAQAREQGVYGLTGQMAALTPPPETAVAAARSEPAVPAEAPFVEPPRLDGVIRRGAAAFAIFSGEACPVGAEVPATSFRVAAVGRSTVTLRSRDGQELRLDLLK